MYRRLNRYNRANSATSPQPPYVALNPHGVDSPISSQKVYPDVLPFVQIATFDPGVVNTGFRIERRFIVGNRVHVITIVQERLTFVRGESHYLENSLLILELYRDVLSYCHYILIESQLPINIEAVRFSQHLITWLMTSLKGQGFRPIIIEIDPKFKSSMFGAPKMKKPELKKWAVQQALMLLQRNEDHETVKKIQNDSKKDDHGDVVCYCEAWWEIMCRGVFCPTHTASTLLAPLTLPC